MRLESGPLRGCRHFGAGAWRGNYTHIYIIRYIHTPFPTKCDLGVVVPQIKLQLRGAQVLGMELEAQEVDKPRQCLQKKTILQYFYIYIHLCTSL